MKYVHIQRTAELASRQQLWCVCSTNIGSCSWHSALFGNPYFKMTDFLNECIGMNTRYLVRMAISDWL